MSFGDEASEDRDSDVGGDLPDAHRHACPVKPLECLTAAGIVDSPRVDPPRSLFLWRPDLMQRGGVALDRLADGVADRLKKVVARSQAVGGRDKTSCSTRNGQRICGVDHLIGDPRPHPGK